MKNEETKHSLTNPDNYKKSIDCSISIVIEKYFNLILDYYNNIYSIVHFKNNTYSKYIIIRGLDTLTNVFLNILSSTKNIDLTYFHCQKAFYFYIEFIDQISDDEKTFLQLTSRDATTYVYKKTIFEICQEHRKQNDSEHNEKCKKIGHFINTLQLYLLKIINLEFNKNNEYLELLKTLSNKLISSANKLIASDLEDITEKIYNKIEDGQSFLKVSLHIVKKISRSSSSNNEFIKNIEKKLESDEFSSKLDDLELFLLN
jgi:hypothetical protein